MWRLCLSISIVKERLCFFLKCFCNAASFSSHKCCLPHCQAYFYGSSPKQVQNSVGLRCALLLAAGHWNTICKLSGNSKHSRLSNSLLIFSFSSETFKTNNNNCIIITLQRLTAGRWSNSVEMKTRQLFDYKLLILMEIWGKVPDEKRSSLKNP